MLSPDQIAQLKSSATMGGASPTATQGMNDQQYQAWKTGTLNTPAPAPAPSGYLSRVEAQYGAAGTSITDTLKKNAEVQASGAGAAKKLGSEVQTGFNTAGDVAGAAFAPINEAPGVKQAGEALGGAGTAISDQLMKIPGYAEFFNGLANHLDAHPEEAHTIGSAFNLAMLGLGGEGEAPAVDAGKDAISAIKGASEAAGPHVNLTPADAVKGVKTALSKDNVAPNLQSSVERLHALTPEVKIGAKSETPLDTYNKYFAQEDKFKRDVKEDTALGKVGEEVGKNYDKVATMRRNAGATMESEMSKVGSTPVDTTEHFPALEEELKKNGLTYDADNAKLSGSRTSKVTAEDKGLLEDYIGKLNDLGAHPTAAELDAFLSRTPADLDVYKSKNSITKTTNGERIIRAHLRDLSGELTADKNPAFKGYEDAKKQYANLSGFLEQGEGHLGKKTQAGDYAKDASLLKSSVKSLLNNGKKDWLAKLEEHTGYPALDHAMLALQAMKDAGNSQGESLLAILSDMSVPKSAAGLAEKAVTGAYKLGKSKLTGSPAEQTRRMIQEFIDKGSSVTPK